jgi:DNA mismatch endonuclease, patch repair protein
MQATPRRDTPAELALRRELHRRGLRFRVDHPPLPKVRRRADIVFTRRKVAVFCDGCWWHGCPEHRTWPKANAEWWVEKIDANRRRDRDTGARLREAGWTVLRIWEHEDPVEAADRVEAIVRSASTR